MTPTSNRIFIDSSVLIEAIKGNKIDLYQSLISDPYNVFYINEAVISEYLYYILAIGSGTSPRTVKEKKKIAKTFADQQLLVDLIKNFNLLKGDESFLSEIPRLMAIYNILPNDAIIIATCKLHGITKIASHDSDFIIPCKKKGIELLIEK